MDIQVKSGDRGLTLSCSQNSGFSSHVHRTTMTNMSELLGEAAVLLSVQAHKTHTGFGSSAAYHSGSHMCVQLQKGRLVFTKTTDFALSAM